MFLDKYLNSVSKPESDVMHEKRHVSSTKSSLNFNRCFKILNSLGVKN